jgi:hypothetical protein
MTHPNILLLGVCAYLYICVLYLAIFEYVVTFYEFINFIIQTNSKFSYVTMFLDRCRLPE